MTWDEWVRANKAEWDALPPEEQARQLALVNEMLAELDVELDPETEIHIVQLPRT